MNYFDVARVRRCRQEQFKTIENEYCKQEDEYKQQLADLEEEKEQLQVSRDISVIWLIRIEKNVSWFFRKACQVVFKRHMF